ncbi:cytochrome aa3 quinol oxidase subunit IV [Solibacillus sp. R5-41]|uniref:cytochrome aa3 quinol oxidase subunit IV n=1 Tax=Solibacillus sp. R5-41 TaxID=2048654 RepID=UPI000C126503|nr:cytochrome aa3 quinol oxidase subunit IV [Solibacillus sp. R5-41]ATP39501.1 cytochrome aa3 quinol oxidase subunit IV [Solibacillus sp. R5-41]
MSDLFPLKQVMGFALSIILTIIAACVYFIDGVSFPIIMTILLVTAFIQAGLQLVVFMHAGETEDKSAIYTNIYYALIIALVTIFGTILCMIWGYL